MILIREFLLWKSGSVFNRNFGIQLWSLQQQNLNFYYIEKLQYDAKNTK
jgi:hypothetical protein